jgi:co-chaperonin GroES (HSP10)
MEYNSIMKLAYEPHKLERSQIRPLKDSIIVADMNFEERTVGGLVIVSDDGKNSGIRPRWAQVYAVGSDQREIQVGQWVCVAHGRWTRGVDIEDETGRHTIRKVDNNDIMMVSDTRVSDETMSDRVL